MDLYSISLSACSGRNVSFGRIAIPRFQPLRTALPRVLLGFEEAEG